MSDVPLRFSESIAWAGMGSFIEVEHGDRFEPRMAVMVSRTGEMLFVEAVDGRVLRVRRGFDGGAPVDVLPGDELLVCGLVP